MALTPDYFAYPLRRRGMDHDLYAWSRIFDRPPVAWSGGAKIGATVLVSLEWFPIVPAPATFKAPGHMQTAYPDYRHYTAREYGTRIGFYRLLDAFAKAGVTASVAVNAAIAERYPSIIRDIVAAGHEIVAHSTDMDGTISTGLAEEDERALIATSLDTLERVSGTRPRGWMSIARSQSFATPRLLVEAGIAYACDWANDDLPYVMTTPAGPLVNVPINHELSDRQIITVQQQSAESYRQQMLDAAGWLASEDGERLLPVHVTPYIMGLPYRIGVFEQLLADLARRPDTRFLRVGDAAEPWLGSRLP
jgi:peptidoglycan/xylan/chitin deacetylase (PgdA/CDA1 family)